MQRTSKLIFLFAIVLLSQTLGYASYISLKTSVSLEIEKEQIKVAISSINKGDESAYNVQAEVGFGNKTVLTQKQLELPVNATYRAQTVFPLSITKAGSYPLILIIHYTDANQYPFSAPLVQTFVYQNEAISPIIGQLKPLTISKEGKLNVTLKNSGNSETKLKIKLVLPRELISEERILTTSLKPRSEENLIFTIKNFSALAGSTYQVFAVVESEDKDWHYTNVFPTTVKVVATQEILGLNYNIILGILILLLVLFFGAQLYRWKK